MRQTAQLGTQWHTGWYAPCGETPQLQGAERDGVDNSPARAGPPLSDRLPQYSPGPRAGATAEVGIVKFDRPPPPAHPTPQSGSGQAGSDCPRPGKTGLRVAEGPGESLRVSGDLNLRVPARHPQVLINRCLRSRPRARTRLSVGCQARMRRTCQWRKKRVRPGPLCCSGLTGSERRPARGLFAARRCWPRWPMASDRSVHTCNEKTRTRSPNRRLNSQVIQLPVPLSKKRGQ